MFHGQIAVRGIVHHGNLLPASVLRIKCGILYLALIIGRFPLRIKRHRIHQVHDRKLRNLIQNLCYHAVCLLLHQAVDVPAGRLVKRGAKDFCVIRRFYGVKEILIRHKYIVRRFHPHRIRHVESGALCIRQALADPAKHHTAILRRHSRVQNRSHLLLRVAVRSGPRHLERHHHGKRTHHRILRVLAVLHLLSALPQQI